MATDTKYLERHGRQWRVRVKVPAPARIVLNKTKLIHPLHTDSLTEANRKKVFHVLLFKAMIEAALRPGAEPIDDLATEAKRFRELIQAEQLAQSKIDYDDPLYPEGIVRQPVTEELVDRAYEIEEKFGTARALAFHRHASGQATPLKEHLEAWLNESEFSGRTKRDHRVAVGELEGWCGQRRIEPSLQGVTRRVAGTFISENLKPGRSNKTVNKKISSLSTYWKWLLKRGHAVENPWAGQSLPKPRAHLQGLSSGKRPYTDQEVATLLTGPANKLLHDLMRIAALSGMRIEEICSLTVRDCGGGAFRITKAKSPAGIREVPIHSDLRKIVESRTRHRSAGDRLFKELPPPPASRIEDNRYSDPATKAFTRYRRQVGVDERTPARRQSNVDFHSFRRWFITKAHEALQAGAIGFTAWTVADVVGHDREQMALGMTLGRYAAPSELKARKACVEAVRLPRSLTGKRSLRRSEKVG